MHRFRRTEFVFKCVRARVFLRFRSFLWKTYRKCIILYSKNHQTFRLPQNNIKPKRTKSPLRLNCRTSSASAWRGPHCSLVSYTILYYKIKLYYSVRYYTILLQWHTFYRQNERENYLSSGGHILLDGDSEGIWTPAGRAQWISSPSP